MSLTAKRNQARRYNNFVKAMKENRAASEPERRESHLINQGNRSLPDLPLESFSFASVEEVEKSMSPARQRALDRGFDFPIAQGRPQIGLKSGGDGYVKTYGIPYPVLRLFAQKTPYVAAVVRMRCRDIATADYGVVPDLDAEKKELQQLRQVFVGYQKEPSFRRVADNYRPRALSEDMYRELRQACTVDGLTSSEIAYRLNLALLELTLVAEGHAHEVGQILQTPNNSRLGWASLLQTLVKDLLELGVGYLEKRRTSKPLSPVVSLPRCTNPILELCKVDAATIRPIIDIHGDLLGGFTGVSADQYSFEQFVNGQVSARFRRCDLLRLCDVIPSDIHWKGYPLGPLEHLGITMMLSAKGDQALMEELNRDYFGGFLNIQDPAWQMEDLSSFRTFHENEWERTKKLPMMLTSENSKVSYISAAPHQGGRDKYAHETRLDWAKRVCAIFGFPVTRLGIFESANYSTSETDREYGDDGLQSLMDMLDDQLTESLVSEWGYTDIRYASSMRRLESKKLEEAEKRMELGIDMVNDVRMEFGRIPHQTGDNPLKYFNAFFEEKGRMDAQQGMEEEGIDDEQTGETPVGDEEVEVDEAERFEGEEGRSNGSGTVEDVDGEDTLKAMIGEVQKAFPGYDVEVSVEEDALE